MVLAKGQVGIILKFEVWRVVGMRIATSQPQPQPRLQLASVTKELNAWKKLYLYPLTMVIPIGKFVMVLRPPSSGYYSYNRNCYHSQLVNHTSFCASNGDSFAGGSFNNLEEVANCADEKCDFSTPTPTCLDCANETCIGKTGSCEDFATVSINEGGVSSSGSPTVQLIKKEPVKFSGSDECCSRSVAFQESACEQAGDPTNVFHKQQTNVCIDYPDSTTSIESLSIVQEQVYDCQGFPPQVNTNWGRCNIGNLNNNVQWLEHRQAEEFEPDSSDLGTCEFDTLCDNLSSVGVKLCTEKGLRAGDCCKSTDSDLEIPMDFSITLNVQNAVSFSAATLSISGTVHPCEKRYSIEQYTLILTFPKRPKPIPIVMTTGGLSVGFPGELVLAVNDGSAHYMQIPVSFEKVGCQITASASFTYSSNLTSFSQATTLSALNSLPSFSGSRNCNLPMACQSFNGATRLFDIYNTSNICEDDELAGEPHATISGETNSSVCSCLDEVINLIDLFQESDCGKNSTYSGESTTEIDVTNAFEDFVGICEGKEIVSAGYCGMIEGDAYFLKSC